MNLVKRGDALRLVDALGCIAALGGVASSVYFHNWVAVAYAAALCLMFARVLRLP